jgi:hypothetical protein
MIAARTMRRKGFAALAAYSIRLAYFEQNPRIRA